MAGKRQTKKPDHAIELAAKLLDSLQAKKVHGDYPISLRRLAETADPGASSDVLHAAVGKPLFTKAAFLVKPPDKKGFTIQQAMDSPVGLWDDAKMVACHASTLAFVQAVLPSGPPTEWKKWVNRGGKGAFKKSFANVIDEQSPNALLKVLRTLRHLGDAGYPLTLRALAEATNRMPLADAANAMTKSTFLNAVLFAAKLPKTITVATAKKFADAPLALREDIDRLAGSSLLLEYGIRTCRKTRDCAFHIEEIANKVLGTAKNCSEADLRNRFVQVTVEKLASGSTPRTIGWINKKSKSLLFLTEDLQPKFLQASHANEADRKRQTAEAPVNTTTVGLGVSAVPPASASTATTAVDDHFVPRFDEAFRRLDHDRGSNNFVWLTDLRRALTEYSREQFDAGLRRLREIRRYKLNAGEGHFGVSDEQKQSSICEAGTIYLSVSRIES